MCLTHSRSVVLLRIRYFDVFICSGNILFLLFLLIKSFRSRKKLTPNKPLLFSVICLLVLVTSTSLVRCVYTILFPHHAFADREIFLKILWLAVRLTLLWTELTVLLFGICFGKTKRKIVSIDRCVSFQDVFIPVNNRFERWKFYFFLFSFRRFTSRWKWVTDLIALIHCERTRFVLRLFWNSATMHDRFNSMPALTISIPTVEWNSYWSPAQSFSL